MPLLISVLLIHLSLRQVLIELDDDWGGGIMVFVWPSLALAASAVTWLVWAALA